MIQISNADRDFIIRFIEEMNQRMKPQDNREYNLQRMAKVLSKKIKNKKSTSQK